MTDQLAGERPRGSRGFSTSARATLFVALAVFALVGAAPRDTAVIVNSGSTNTAGYKIQVWSNGTATLAMLHTPSTAAKSFTISSSAVARFFADLAAARKGIAQSVPCMKSASFGTSTHVTWQGWISPDLDCPPKNSVGTALLKDVDAIREASGVGALPPLRHTPLQMNAPSPEPT